MELHVERVTHRYAGRTVLDAVELDVPAGRIVCVVGPSGCGKSTLLRLIGGLERPSEGRVTRAGEAPPGCLNALTYVFQDFALLPWRSARGNIELALEPHRLTRRQRREIADEVLARTRLADFADALPKQLSGGMRQRVAIARALAVRPAVMLMDEPLSALDAQTRELLTDDLVALWTREPFTAVYVTHNLDEAARLGHRIAVLSRRPGRLREVIEIDTPLAQRRPEDAPAVTRRLWSLMREEAEAADRELADG